jgi:hypothetical protein
MGESIKMESSNKKYLIASIIIFAIFLILKLNPGFFSIISIQGIPEQIRSVNFDGLDVSAKSPYFGSIRNDAVDESGSRRRAFCSSNDGDAALSNSISGGNSLNLYSSMSLSGRACGDNNYLTSEFYSTKGKLNFEYSLSSSSSRGDIGASNAVVQVNGETYISTHTCDSGVGGCNFGSDSKNGNFEIIVDSPKNIKIEIITTSSSSGASSASLNINFISEIICKTDADTNCNGIIERGELGDYIIKWVSGDIERSDLAQVISSWASQ